MTANANKHDIINYMVAESDGLTKAEARRYFDLAIKAITALLAKHKGRVTIVGFGTFKVTKRKPQTGRNPRTGEPIKIKAANVPKFTPGKALKDAVN